LGTQTCTDCNLDSHLAIVKSKAVGQYLEALYLKSESRKVFQSAAHAVEATIAVAFMNMDKQLCRDDCQRLWDSTQLSLLDRYILTIMDPQMFRSQLRNVKFNNQPSISTQLRQLEFYAGETHVSKIEYLTNLPNIRNILVSVHTWVPYIAHVQFKTELLSLLDWSCSYIRGPRITAILQGQSDDENLDFTVTTTQSEQELRQQLGSWLILHEHSQSQFAATITFVQSNKIPDLFWNPQVGVCATFAKISTALKKY
jgi:hypothetical protein